MVRLAEPSDASDVIRLMQAFRDHLGRDDPPDATVESSVRHLLDDPATDYLLAGAPAEGVCQLRYRHCVWLGADDCTLEDLYVSEAGRGSGLGRALVGVALDRARERGCARVVLDTHDTNRAAVSLYESFGFASSDGPGTGTNIFMRLRL
jgi:ribosomal protein S18 acetylase RimI-like enzyme